MYVLLLLLLLLHLLLVLLLLSMHFVLQPLQTIFRCHNFAFAAIRAAAYALFMRLLLFKSVLVCFGALSLFLLFFFFRTGWDLYLLACLLYDAMPLIHSGLLNDTWTMCMCSRKFFFRVPMLFNYYFLFLVVVRGIMTAVTGFSVSQSPNKK